MIPIVIASFILCLGGITKVANAITNRDEYESGRSPGGISIGEVIKIKEHPAIVLILESNSFRGCVGSIISKSTILTTVQCTKENVLGMTVRVGTAAANEVSPWHKVVAIRIHEGYEKLGDVVTNDLALLKVLPSLTLSKTVSPIPLNSNDNTITDYTILKVVGWKTLHSNETMTLRSARLRAIECFRDVIVENITPSSRICAVPHDRGVTQVCQGNLGSPITMANRLVGIVSWSEGCITTKNPGVFLHLAGYRGWIDANVKIMEKITEGIDLDTFLQEDVPSSSVRFWKW